MKKIILFILLLCSISFILKSAVPYETALTVAQNFTLEKGNFSDVKSIRITHNQTFSENDSPIFYIFNVNDNGFVIVSASEIANPILAFSFDHNFVMNPSLNE